MKKRRNCHEKFAPIVNTRLLPIIIVAPVVPASALTVSAKLFSAYLITHNLLLFFPGRRCRFNAMTLGYPAILSHVPTHLSLFPYLGSLKTTFALPIPFTAVLYHTISALVTRLAPVIPKHRLVRMCRLSHDSEVARCCRNRAAVCHHCLRWYSFGVVARLTRRNCQFWLYHGVYYCRSRLPPHTLSIHRSSSLSMRPSCTPAPESFLNQVFV